MLSKLKIYSYFLVIESIAAKTADNIQIHIRASIPLGAEVTGLYNTPDSFFFNVQHPATTNSIINRGTEGVVQNPDFDKVLELPMGIEKESVTVAEGTYQRLLTEGINGVGRIEKANGDFIEYSIN